MTIGILGGSFNPLHNGHLYIAQEAIKSLCVDQVWFTPSFAHPFPEKQNYLPFDIRLNLIKKTISNSELFHVCDLEKDIIPPSYTSKLFKLLIKKYPQHKFIFLIGYDIVPELGKWYNYQWLKDNMHFLIIKRGNKEKLEGVKELKHYQILKIKPMEVSSTLIRQLIKENKPINHLVPTEIAAEITSLYT